MTGCARLAAAACLCVWLGTSPSSALAQPAPASPTAPLVVTVVRVHGNHSTPDDEVLRIAAIVVGAPLAPSDVAAAQQRLADSGRFARVEIRQRARSIDDPSQVALIILVAEHASVRPIDVGLPPIPGPLGRLRSQTMFLPILNVRDGYGLTYGVRTTLVGGAQSTSRLSVPASWGGTRQLALEGERTFTSGAIAGRGALTRVRGSAGLWRQEHPFFDQGQFRRYVDAEISIRPRAFVGAGATVGTASVSFGEVDDRMTSGGVFALIDTRRDPGFPRNAVFARSSWTRLSFARPEQSNVPTGGRSRWQHDVRGYLGVIGQVVLAARVQVDASNGPLPAYAKPVFGGADTLRGLRAGSAVGDNLWAATVEARAPFTSVLRSTRLGVVAFYDTGAIWDHGQRWRNAGREEGVGAGIFAVSPVFQWQLSVARGLGRSTRVHLSTGVSF